jgi:protein-tyrosine phosphatase
MTAEAQAELVGLGGSADGFVARRFQASLVGDADLVLTATTEIRRAVLEEVPGALRRTFTWRELATLVDGRTYDTPAALVADAADRRGETAGLDLDTEDPIGRSAQVYARVSGQIDEAITTIARALTRSSAQ